MLATVLAILVIHQHHVAGSEKVVGQQVDGLGDPSNQSGGSNPEPGIRSRSRS